MATRRRETTLKTRPRVARPLTGRGALPSLANLAQKTPEELSRTLARFGIRPDLQALERHALKAYEPIEKLVARGLVPDDAAWANVEKDLNRRVKSSLVDMTRAAIRLYRLERVRREGGKLTWIATLRNTCDSCEKRHGKTKTLAQWERAGMPGDPVLLCCSFEPRCQCTLVPAGDDSEA